METDYLGLKAGTIRGLAAIASLIYLAAFFGYNVYASLSGKPYLQDLPYLEFACGYILYYLGLRTDLPNLTKFGGTAASILAKVFTRTKSADGSDLPVPKAAQVTTTSTEQVEVQVADPSIHDENQLNS